MYVGRHRYVFVVGSLHTAAHRQPVSAWVFLVYYFESSCIGLHVDKF